MIWIGNQATSPIPGLDDVAMGDINSSLQIVGERETTLIQGFVFQNGVITDFGTLPGGTFSQANAVSENGKVVGTWGNQITGNPALHAFIWHNEMMTDINVRPRIGKDHVGNDINDKAQITGWMGVAPFPPFYGEAYIWDNGVTTPLGFPLGGTNSEGRALNDLGDVCGHYRIPNPAGGTSLRRACLWADGLAIDLGVLAGHLSSYGNDLNDQRQVVGYAEGPGSIKAFMWQAGAMASLDDLIPRQVNVQVRFARSINNAGQIAADGIDLIDGRQVALRLTPIPPPPGDCDCNGVVNIDDLLAVINEWGPALPTTTADFDLDLDVDIDDLLTVINQWG